MSAPTNYRDIFAHRNMEICRVHYKRLTDWEKAFIQTIEPLQGSELSQRQYNTLTEIASELPTRGYNARTRAAAPDGPDPGGSLEERKAERAALRDAESGR